MSPCGWFSLNRDRRCKLMGTRVRPGRGLLGDSPAAPPPSARRTILPYPGYPRRAPRGAAYLLEGPGLGVAYARPSQVERADVRPGTQTKTKTQSLVGEPL